MSKCRFWYWHCGATIKKQYIFARYKICKIDVLFGFACLELKTYTIIIMKSDHICILTKYDQFLEVVMKIVLQYIGFIFDCFSIHFFRHCSFVNTRIKIKFWQFSCTEFSCFLYSKNWVIDWKIDVQKYLVHNCTWIVKRLKPFYHNKIF